MLFVFLLLPFSSVLIVAKCIVNNNDSGKNMIRAIVLIVAKCIVNQDVIDLNIAGLDVLIVAKCIVKSCYS